jgi:hypothetical protein
MRGSRTARGTGLLLGVLFLHLPLLASAQAPARPSTPAKPVKADTTAAAKTSQDLDAGVPAPTFGSQFGYQFRTVTGTIPSLQAYLTRPLSSKLRWGLEGFASSGEDLREYALAGTIGYHLSLSGTFAVYAYGGLGFLYSTWDYYQNATFSDNSWAIYIPGGLTLEIDAGSNLFTITGMINLHNIEYTNSPGRDRGSASLLFGVAI